MTVSSGLLLVYCHVDITFLIGYLHCVALEEIGGVIMHSMGNQQREVKRHTIRLYLTAPPYH